MTKDSDYRNAMFLTTFLPTGDAVISHVLILACAAQIKKEGSVESVSDAHL